MSETVENVSKSKLGRGTSKHFVSSDAKTSGAVDTISHFIHTEHGTDDDTLIDIKVNNPLKHIIELLKDIKRRQATTFSLKFTIPLIALPVFLLAAFQIGRFQTFCTPVVSSKTGVIKNITVALPSEKEASLFSMLNLFRSSPKIKSGVPLSNETRTILIDKNGETLKVLHAKEINLNSYSDQNVIVTGNYSSCTSVITLESLTNITNF